MRQRHAREIDHSIVIFLDIDDTLSSLNSVLAYYHLHGNHLTEEETLNKVSIGLIKGICDLTNASIVISSTWKLGRTIHDFRRIFKYYGWNDFPIIGKTSVHKTAYRGTEIQMYLNAHPEINNFCIIDDSSDMLESQLARFVKVNPIHGFTCYDLCKALRILGFPDEQLEDRLLHQYQS